MVDGYVPFAAARASQVDLLERSVDVIATQVLAAQANRALAGSGPIFLGIGASFAAAAAPVWTLRARGIHSWRLNAGEYPLPYPASNHTIIGVSQSGRSAETLAVMRAIDRALQIAVVNVSPSPLGALAKISIGLGNLPDSYASTIGYTATVMALGMIADAWDGGPVDRSWSAIGAALRDVETRLLEQAPRLAAPLADARSVDFAAASPSAGTAEAGSLLLREVARVPATGISTRQYLHGAMESASGGTAHVLIGEEREAQVALTLARAHCPVILVTPVGAQEEENLSVFAIPAMPPAPRAILEALVMQSLALETARARGIDPDAFVFHHDDTKVA